MREDASFPGRRAGDLPYHAAAALDGAPGLRHWFLGRRGGASAGPWASLNLGYATGDDRDTVERNRLRAWEALGLPRPPLLPSQVHGNDVVTVDAGNVERFMAEPPRADALITALRGQPLALLTADCLPVVVVDRRTPALAVVHAGWRGTVRSILWKTLLTMFEEFGTQSEDCLAAIGPAIAGPCYEVGEDVREAFVKGLPYGQDVLTAGAPLHWFADLREANRRQLLDARLPASQVATCPYCTHCEADGFYSARRDRPDSGRQATVAMLT